MAASIAITQPTKVGINNIVAPVNQVNELAPNGVNGNNQTAIQIETVNEDDDGEPLSNAEDDEEDIIKGLVDDSAGQDANAPPTEDSDKHIAKVL